MIFKIQELFRNKKVQNINIFRIKKCLKCKKSSKYGKSSKCEKYSFSKSFSYF
jgi:hypothetical protein